LTTVVPIWGSWLIDIHLKFKKNQFKSYIYTETENDITSHMVAPIGRKPELACMSVLAALEVFTSMAGEVVTSSWSWRGYLHHARRPTAQRATDCSREGLDCDLDRVQRGEQRFKYAMRRSLVGRHNGLRDCLDISSCLPSCLRRGVDQTERAGLLMDRRVPSAIRSRVPQDRAAELWPVGAFTAGMQSASDGSCLVHA
jgi:hypothetical protein